VVTRHDLMANRLKVLTEAAEPSNEPNAEA